MKYLIIALSLFITQLSLAQDSTKVIKASTPKIVTKLEFGKTVQINTYELKFVRVLTDSRCPKNVTCVWAGEVTVLVDVFKNGKFVSKKTLNFGRASYSNRDLLNLISTEEIQVAGFSVLPYPVDGVKIKDEDYYIQLEVKN
jgi:hypothetical protein